MANEPGGFQESILYQSDFLPVRQLPSPTVPLGSQSLYSDIIFRPPVPRLDDWRNTHLPTVAAAFSQWSRGYDENPPTLFLNVSC